MIRRIALAGAAGALALGGLALTGLGNAGAAPVIINVADSANISCTIASTAKLSPALKNNWDQQAHEAADGETNPYVQAIPDTKFNTDGPNTVSSKAKSISCTGTATEGTKVATISGVQLTLSNDVAAVDNPPLQDDNTCAGLLAGTSPEDTAATYKTDVKFKTVPGGAKMVNANATGIALAPAGIGFGLTGGTWGGSLAGGNGKTQANLASGDTLGQVTSPPASSAQPVPQGIQCEATLKIKADKPGKPGTGSASLKAPKGLKKIPVGQSFLDPSPAGASTVCLRKGSVCP
jgi:hypothetical protein